MKTSLETKALGLALLAASISLGGTLLAATPIRWFTNSHDNQAGLPAPFPELASSPKQIEQGRQSFAMSCAECHSDDAHGDEGPDLHHLAISNARIAATIKRGVKGEMPTFAKKYDDAQIAALVAYLRSLP